MKFCFLGAWCAIVCLALIGCSDETISPVSSAELAELHGSAVIIADHLIPIPEDESPFINSPSFQRHFKRLGRIALSDSVVLGVIRGLEIDSKGRLLITDLVRQEVFLFGPGGEFLTELSAETCDPGLDWNPFSAVFSPRGEILVTQPSPRHIRFDSSGSCMEILDLGFGVHRANVLTDDQEVFAFVARYDGYGVRHFDARGSLVRRIGEQTWMKKITNAYYAGGLVQDSIGRLYLAVPFSAQIRVYEPSGQAVGNIGTRPDYFRQIEEDLPKTIGSDPVTAMSNALGIVSLVSNLFLLDTGKLLLTISNHYEKEQNSDKRMGIQVISTSGEVLNREPILTHTSPDFYVRAARDGLLYFATGSVEDENGDWGNQGLEVYQFVL